MTILNQTPGETEPRERERSLLGSLYAILGLFAFVVGVAAIVAGALAGRSEALLPGVGSLLVGFIFLGLSEFFRHVARITAATEETARLLRERRP